MSRSFAAWVAALTLGLTLGLGGGPPALAHHDDDASVPAGFSPSSTSWTSPSTGWVLGWTPCAADLCPTLLHTSDGGHTWSERHAPNVRPSEVGSQTRVFFAERHGDSLGLITNGHHAYVSYDSARTWRPLDLAGVDMIGGIGANVRAMFVVGHAQVGDQVTTQAFTSPIHQPRWRRLRGAATSSHGSQWSTKSVVATAGRGVQIATSTYGGTVRLWTATNGRRFVPAHPCNPLSVMYPGFGADQQQFVLCSSNPGRGRMTKVLRTGSAEDRFMTVVGQAPTAGITSDFAVTPGSAIAVGATMNSAALVHMSFDRGRTWQTTLTAFETGAVRDLSFQDDRHGVLVAGYGASGSSVVYRTTDGGHSWTALDL